MIHPELLETLRCPIDPQRLSTLLLEDDHLLCARCRVAYPIKDGFPVMIVDEAQLPPGCKNLTQLPCQQPSSLAGPAPSPFAGEGEGGG